jgi:hypothetical protein
MANEIYHRTNWGEAKPEDFGDMYFDPSATNKLYNRSTYYENSDATDKILGDIPNKASIVLTPTGYSEDSINTAIPPYQVLPEELVTNGTFDTDSDWTKGTGWTIGNGVASNDGSASYLTSTASFRWQIGKKYRVSLEVTAYSSGQISLPFDATGANLNYENSIGVKSTIIVAGATNPIYIYSNSFNGSIDNVSVQEIQEADFTFARNSSATRVNQAGLIEASQSNDTPRLDYTTGQGAFLLEPQSTNLIKYSEDFSQWSASSGASVVTNNAISPDGTQNASTFTFDGTTNGRVELLTDGVTSSEDVTFSVYLKTLSGTEQVYIGHSVFGLKTVTVDDQWKRYTSTATASAGFAYPRVRIDSATSVLVWGYQLEQQSFATSYIPTVGSTVTRSAETANSSGNSDLFNDSEGVLYGEISALADDGTYRAFAISDDSSANRIYLGFGNGSNQLRLEMTASSSAQVILTHNVSDTKEFQKLAVRYKTNDVSFYVNGLEVGTDTNATIPTGLDTLKFTSGSTGSILYARTKNMSVFKEELTALELEKLTSWRDFRDLAESQQYTLVTIKSDAIVVLAYGTTSGGGGVSGGGSGGGGGY